MDTTDFSSQYRQGECRVLPLEGLSRVAHQPRCVVR